MLTDFSSRLRPAYGWSVSAPTGRAWAFTRSDDTPVTIKFTPGMDPLTIRSPKMARVEAVLLVSEGTVPARRLAQLATLEDAAEARRIVDRLNLAYDRDETAYRIEQVAGGYRLLTRPELAFWLGKIHHRQAELKLSPPALETLAIVAYRQPTTRVDIEAIRRVQCSDMLKQLMDRGLVRIAGQEDSLGRPFLYETTRLFLEMFGLGSLNDLPHAESLRVQRAIPVVPTDESGPGDEPAKPSVA